MTTPPDERLLDDEAWHLALMQACTGLTAGANAIGRDRAARIEQTERLVALLRRTRESWHGIIAYASRGSTQDDAYAERVGKEAGRLLAEIERELGDTT